jgi:UDP-galactopyranose mutase
VHFVGRLATYRYYNMDQVVGQALAEFKRIQEIAIPTISPLNGAGYAARLESDAGT